MLSLGFLCKIMAGQFCPVMTYRKETTLCAHLKSPVRFSSQFKWISP